MITCDRCHRKFADYAALKQHYTNQHPNASWPEEFEARLSDEKNLQAYKANLRPTKASHTNLIVGVILIVIVVGAAAIYLPGMLQPSTANPECASFPFPSISGQNLAVHDHVMLMIYVNGQQVNVPVNVGEGDSGPCTQPLHVHSSDPGADVIHIESPQARSYTLRDFFKVWAATPGIGGPKPVVFDQNQIFNYTVGSGYELRMYVNGQQSTDFGSLVLQSHMIIVVAYGNSATNWAQYQQLSGEQWPYPSL
jgi:hypothetical protein